MELSKYDFKNIEFVNRLNDEQIKEGMDYINNHEDRLNKRDELFAKAEKYVKYFTRIIFLLVYTCLFISFVLVITEGEQVSDAIMRVLGWSFLSVIIISVFTHEDMHELMIRAYIDHKNYKIPSAHEREMYVAWKERIRLEQFLRKFYFNQQLLILDKWVNVDGNTGIWLHLWCKYENNDVIYCKDEMISVMNVKASSELDTIRYDVITDTVYIPFDQNGNVIFEGGEENVKSIGSGYRQN